MKISIEGREHVRFEPARGAQHVLERAAANRHINHTAQYLFKTAEEAKMLFRASDEERLATPRLGAAPEGGAPSGGGTAGGGEAGAPHQPRARATRDEERDELHRRARAADAARSGAWAYRVLGVPPDADQATVRQAYRRLSLRLHPDKNAAEERDAATKAVQHLNDAYDMVRTEENRRTYDAGGGTVDVGEVGEDGAARPGGSADVWVDIHGVRRDLSADFELQVDKNGNPLRRRDYLGVNAAGELLPPMASLIYLHVPYYYTWSAGTGWRRRARPKFAANVVARVINLTPKAGDAFYLRMMLMSDRCIGARCVARLARPPTQHASTVAPPSAPHTPGVVCRRSAAPRVVRLTRTLGSCPLRTR